MQQFNYYFLKQLSLTLETQLINRKLRTAFTQNKNEVIFEFGDELSSFFLKANFEGAVSVLSFPREFARAKKNSVELFGAIHGLTVDAIHQHLNERAFSLSFESDLVLTFKLFGNMSNILLSRTDKVLSLFKNNLERDWSIRPSELDRNIDQSEHHIISSNFDLKNLFPTFDKDMKKLLGKLITEQKSDHEKLDALHSVIQEISSPPYHIHTASDGTPKLSLLRIQSQDEVMMAQDPIEACNVLAKKLFTDFSFQKEKEKTLAKTDQDIKRTKSYIQKTQEKLLALKENRAYDEIANILMANLHVPVSNDNKKIKVLDFYTNQEIDIKINPNMSLQRNAENYYRKAKNQSIEAERLHDNIEKKKAEQLQLEETRNQINAVQSRKELKPYLKDQNQGSSKINNIEQLPFHSQSIMGYEVLIGKNAKSNDLLTLKYARKNDLWLHAKDVSGSHVVIKSAGTDTFPKNVIEIAAQIAAWHSKRKHDSLCPVIYTYKKFVNKPKGFAPGMVRVMQEKVIMVPPKRDPMA